MSVTPFLKWAGGKRWLGPTLRALVEDDSPYRLVEPFVGGGAAFFSLAPARALLADSNAELMATYRAIQSVPEVVIGRLAGKEINIQTFSETRKARPRSDAGRAARMIYLNRTAFNGLYRVNKNNQFNVPFGCKPGTQFPDHAALEAVSRLLKRASLQCQDFRATLKGIRSEGDIVYVDPPYTVKHDNNGFRRYNNHIFSWNDQIELARALIQLVQRGVRVIVSNAHHADIRALYPRALFHAICLERNSCMAANPARRGSCAEWLLVSASIADERRTLARKLAAIS